MGQDHRIHLVVPEHLHILSLLLLVGHIVDDFLFLFLCLAVLSLLCLAVHHFGFHLLAVLVHSAAALSLLILTVAGRFNLQTHRQGQVLAVQVLEQDVIVHPLTELIVLQAAELDKGTDVIPVLVILFLLGLAHAGELVRHLLGDVLGDLFHKAVVLEGAPGHVQRQIRTVNDTLQQQQEFRDHFLDIIRNKHLVVVQLDGSLNGLVLHIDLGEVQNSLEIERIVHIQVNPEQGLLVIVKDFPVKLQVLLLGAVVGMLCPQRSGLIEQLRTPSDFELLPGLFLRLFQILRAVLSLLILGLLLLAVLLLGFRMNLLNHHVIVQLLVRIDDLGLLGVRLGQVDLRGHKGTVLLDDFPGLVLVAELQAVLIQKQGDDRSHLGPVPLAHGELRAAVTLPVNRLRPFLIRKGINVHFIRHHKRGVKSQSKVTDNLVRIALILVLFDEVRGAGECDLVNVFLHFIRRHTQSIVYKSKRLLLRVHNHVNTRPVPLRQGILSHHIQLLQLGHGVTAVGDQFPVENVMV